MGDRTNTPVNRSKPKRDSMQNPTGNRMAPSSGWPVCTLIVIANQAANARMAPAM